VGVRLLDPNSTPSERAIDCRPTAQRKTILLLTVRSGSHDLSEFNRIYTLPDRARRSGSAQALSSFMLADGSVDRKIQRKHLVIHGKLEVPIGRLILQNGRVRDLALRKNFDECRVDGSKAEAQTPDGTRVATPNPLKDGLRTVINQIVQEPMYLTIGHRKVHGIFYH
jgi:hypothetical protein